MNIIPLSKQLHKKSPVHVVIGSESQLDYESIALVEQICTIDTRMLKKKIGCVPDSKWNEIDRVINLQKKRGITTQDIKNSFNSKPQVDEKILNKYLIDIKIYDSFLESNSNEFAMDTDTIRDQRDLTIKMLKDYCEEYGLTQDDVLKIINDKKLYVA